MAAGTPRDACGRSDDQLYFGVSYWLARPLLFGSFIVLAATFR
jgi:hypothetical protein